MKISAVLALFFVSALPALAHADNIRLALRDVGSSESAGDMGSVSHRADEFRMSLHRGRTMNDVLVMIGVLTTESAPTLVLDELADGVRGVWHDPIGTTAWDIDNLALMFPSLMNDRHRNYGEFVASLFVGSYLAGFACHQNGTACGNSGKHNGIPFTGSGFVTPATKRPSAVAVPEPSTLILLGLSFGALGLGRRRRDSIGASLSSLAGE